MLHISARTVEIHRRDIKHRTGLESTAQIIITADRVMRDRPCGCQQPKPVAALVAAVCEVE